MYRYKKETTIRINPETKTKLDEFRQYKNESYDELVRKLIVVAKTCEKEPKLSQKTIQEIKEARERIKKKASSTQKKLRRF